ncbi:MAG: hypothetical protein GXO75_05845 [Calditrichaeota bacterium]|nr:hypothetical protein [Calditrichota bacterium]
MDDVIAKFKNDSTMVGYFITDEPKIPAYANLGRVVAYLRARDPERLCYINIYPRGDDYDNYVQQFLETVKPEILSYDRYVFFKDWDGDWGVTGSPDRDQIFASLEKLNAEIKRIGPIMIGLKTVGVFHSLHVPFGGVPLPKDAPEHTKFFGMQHIFRAAFMFIFSEQERKLKGVKCCCSDEGAFE